MFSDAYADWLTNQWWFWVGLFLVVFTLAFGARIVVWRRWGR